jgi:hypothetical protein
VVKFLLEDVQTLSVLLTTLAAKFGHLARGTTESKLELAFADFLKVSASLDKGINLSEDLFVFL